MGTNDQRYWFRAKRYGLGWSLPLTWQGWAVFVAWILVLILGNRFVIPRTLPMRCGFIVAMTIIMLVICYWKGEPSGRRWNSGEN
jgi:hypothetical protein